MASRRHPAVEADIERGSYAMAIVCVAGIIFAACLFGFVLLAGHNADREYPIPRPTEVTSTPR